MTLSNSPLFTNGQFWFLCRGVQATELVSGESNYPFPVVRAVLSLVFIVARCLALKKRLYTNDWNNVSNMS